MDRGKTNLGTAALDNEGIIKKQIGGVNIDFLKKLKNRGQNINFWVQYYFWFFLNKKVFLELNLNRLKKNPHDK